ncbi:hypothetical protein BC834DRAFT_875516 [Gloeopeniophorella convolvens]|nr:hypothetical protein BC834DRAFT_875516 [Gloeopeniophorella convolvens]
MKCALFLWTFYKYSQQMYVSSAHTDWNGVVSVGLGMHTRCLEASDGLHLKMTRHPSEKSVSFDDLADLYGADDFQDALADFIVKHNFPHLSSRAAQTQANNTLIPFRSVSVYNKIKFYITTRGSNQGSQETFDSVHSRPSRLDKQERVVPARFDTVLVKIPGNARGINKFRVAQVRTVFSISPLAAAEIFHSSVSDQPRHLAYVEWFTPFTPLPDRDCVEAICRSVHLYPRFGPSAPRDWQSYNVLELCERFFVNPFIDLHTFSALSSVTDGNEMSRR